jgi:hypothetical protein
MRPLGWRGEMRNERRTSSSQPATEGARQEISKDVRPKSERTGNAGVSMVRTLDAERLLELASITAPEI